MDNLNDKLKSVEEQRVALTGQIKQLMVEIGRATKGKERTLSGVLKENRAELAELFRKQTIIMRLIENE
ncbi:MAG: hypothetical protein AB2697_21815 [Candidatus Thiodiazotropha endolucinida]|nr:hypothetical protein [Candidatus Thiodiazotropha endolucinida]